MLRAFSAVEIADEEVLDELEQVQEAMDLGFSTVDRGRMHVTFQFFEELAEDEIEEVKRSMDSVDFGSFQVKLKGVGAFPSREYIRVVWAGFEKERKLRRLKEQLSEHGVEEDNGNRFKPHVTLIRVRDVSGEKKRKLQRMLNDYSEHLFGEVEVERVKLMESKRTPHGTRYSQLYSKQL